MIDSVSANEQEAEAPAADPAVAPIETDRPRETRKADRLNRSTFADTLAASLRALPSPRGTVVAIDGPWGSGKTTILNFLEEALESYGDESTVVVRFNPWWFAGRAELAGALLVEINSHFGNDKEFKKKGREFLSGALGLGQLVPVFGVGSSAKVAKEMLDRTPPLAKAKADFEQALRDSGKRLYVFVDDVDRLEPSELGDLFSTIKALADFPNAVYVIALDSVQVAKHLNEASKLDGAAYLEKLIQVSFPVPFPDREKLDSLTLEGLAEIIEEPEPHLFDSNEWYEIFGRSLSVLLRTPRDVVRLTNAVRLTYTSVRNEVNVVDFIAFEALRVLEPRVYRNVIANLPEFGLPADLIGRFFGLAEKSKTRRDEVFQQTVALVAQKERRDAVTRILAFLFPDFAEYAGGFGSRPGDSSAHRRLADRETFRSVLSLALVDDLVAKPERQQILEILPKRTLFEGWFLAQYEEKSPDGLTRLSVVLPEAGRHVKQLSDREKRDALDNLLVASDYVMDDDPRLLIGRPRAESAVVGLAISLLEAMDERKERLEAATRAIRDSQSVLIPALLLRRLEGEAGVPTELSAKQAKTNGMGGWSGSVLTIDQLVTLEDAISEHLIRNATEPSFLERTRIVWLLSEWHRWDNNGGTFALWGKRVCESDEYFAKLLEISRYSEPFQEPKMQVGFLCEIIDKGNLKMAANRIVRESHDPKHLTLAHEFLDQLKTAETR